MKKKEKGGSPSPAGEEPGNATAAKKGWSLIHLGGEAIFSKEKKDCQRLQREQKRAEDGKGKGRVLKKKNFRPSRKSFIKRFPMSDREKRDATGRKMRESKKRISSIRQRKWNYLENSL